MSTTDEAATLDSYDDESLSEGSSSGSSAEETDEEDETVEDALTYNNTKSSYTESSYDESLRASSSVSSLQPPKRSVLESPRLHDRVPGGAAAKLMLLGPKSSEESGSIKYRMSTESDNQHVAPNIQPVEEEMMRAREEFTLGSPVDRSTIVEEVPEDHATSANTPTTPSFLNKSEIFHRNASVAVAALLNPDTGDGEIAFPSSPGHYDAKPVVSPTLLTKTAERKITELQTKMLDPTTTLTGLLTAIASPEETNTDLLAYTVRRKNACGALQTLTANNGNRSRICWTVGVLPALTSVLNDGIGHGYTGRLKTEYEAARIRAISSLMNLSTPVKNRIAVFHSPGLVRAVLTTMEEVPGVPRRGCAAILAQMAKSPENRLLLAQVPRLLEVVVLVLQPRPAKMKKQPQKQNKKVYPWSEDGSSSSSSSSSESENEADPEDEYYAEEVTGYDETADELLQGARQNVFAMLGHLVKEKDNAYHLARDLELLKTLVDISRFQESPSHALAVRILAHLTRHRLNKVLAFKPKIVVPALIEATQSSNDDTRLYACYALQNLSQEKSCRQELAIAEHLIEVLCDRCRNGSHVEERLAAISTLKNLCDEPANLIPMTNTQNCISTLMKLANESSGIVQYRACDALATLSHWLRKIATSGYSLDATEQGRPPVKGLFVPSLREVSWNQWN